MITVHLSCGLGNQLFQYSFALYLKEKYNQEVVFDTNGFNFEESRQLEIDILKPNLNTIEDSKLFTNYIGIPYRLRLLLFKINPFNAYIDDKKLFKDSSINKSKFNYFDGYWQTDYYVSKIKNRADFFKPKDSMPLLIENYISEIVRENSVALHIRRGDYFSPLYINRYGVCGVEYYLKAINYIQSNIENPVFFVFSDDLDWVRNNIELPKNTVFIKNEKINSFWYVFLMSKAKHNIISNSSFSWWGAYLNDNKDKIIISPDKWRLDTDITIALKDWIKIPVK